MTDYIVRAMAAGGSVRAFATTTKDLVETARCLHKTTPVATAALGRLLSAASMMGATLKSDTDLLTLTIRGDGPIGGIVATTDNKSRVKGYAHQPQFELLLNKSGKLDVGGAVGSGTLIVSKDLGLKEPVSGQVALVSGEIAEDITYYFATSEQLPSSVGLGVMVDTDCSVKQAGGYIIQLMPDAKEEIVAHLEKELPKLPAVTTMLEEGKTPEDILSSIFAGYDVAVIETITPVYFCSCSVEKIRKVLLNVEPIELKAMLEEDKGATVHCHFCNKDYRFNEDDLRQTISELDES